MSRNATLTPEQQTGKAAFKALAKAYGGQEAVAEETGFRQQEISDCGLPNVAKFASVDLVDFLEDRTVGLPGWPHVTSWLCRRRGGVFVPLPRGGADADGMMRTVAEMAAEFGDVSRAVADAVCPHGPDGEEVNAAEARTALAALDDLDRVSAQLRHKLQSKIKGGQ
ncbi:phage regulatory CII family protein [Sphingobium yanoikuyae]|jgi:hypothetical protein|uniref:phage regulatory CII family protein n=1 Tax=Sphingobium yanoikuyae TaxID=13690 RepID=UPI0028DBAEA9|nr:phage regulatory CII family protein [Sphingobium yanoikuyae]